MAGSSVQYQEVHLHGLQPVRMLYHSEVTPLHQDRVHQRYNEQQGLQKSRVKAKKSLESAVQSIHSACSPSLNIIVDWAAFDALDEKTTPSMGARYLESLEAICLIDDDYKEAAASISQLEFVPETSNQMSQVELKDGHLTIPLSKQAPNVSQSSYKILYELLD